MGEMSLREWHSPCFRVKEFAAGTVGSLTAQEKQPFQPSWQSADLPARRQHGCSSASPSRHAAFGRSAGPAPPLRASSPRQLYLPWACDWPREWEGPLLLLAGTVAAGSGPHAALPVLGEYWLDLEEKQLQIRDSSPKPTCCPLSLLSLPPAALSQKHHWCDRVRGGAGSTVTCSAGV